MSAQTMVALEKASRVRVERKELREAVRASQDPRRMVAEIILECPPCMVNMEIWRLLAWVPRLGSARRYDALLAAGIADVPLWDGTRVGALTIRQALRLAEALRGAEGH